MKNVGAFASTWQAAPASRQPQGSAPASTGPVATARPPTAIKPALWRGAVRAAPSAS